MKNNDIYNSILNTLKDIYKEASADKNKIYSIHSDDTLSDNYKNELLGGIESKYRASAYKNIEKMISTLNGFDTKANRVSIISPEVLSYIQVVNALGESKTATHDIYEAIEGEIISKYKGDFVILGLFNGMFNKNGYESTKMNQYGSNEISKQIIKLANELENLNNSPEKCSYTFMKIDSAMKRINETISNGDYYSFIPSEDMEAIQEESITEAMGL